jgi:hypothetical protein
MTKPLTYQICDTPAAVIEPSSTAASGYRARSGDGGADRGVAGGADTTEHHVEGSRLPQVGPPQSGTPAGNRGGWASGSPTNCPHYGSVAGALPTCSKILRVQVDTRPQAGNREPNLSKYLQRRTLRLLRQRAVACWPGVVGCLLDELETGGDSEFGVNVGEVGLYRAG